MFLESCLPFVGCSDFASKEIYAWDVYKWNVPVFTYNKDVRINVFDAAIAPTGSPSVGGIGGLGTIGTVGMAKL